VIKYPHNLTFDSLLILFRLASAEGSLLLLLFKALLKKSAQTVDWALIIVRLLVKEVVSDAERGVILLVCVGKVARTTH